MTFYLLQLGCDKNRVDGERLLGEIVRHGCALTDAPAAADVIVINTCAFLNAAREESIAAVLEASRYKEGRLKKLVVTGCLPEKYIRELFPALTEADVFLGVKDFDALFPALERALRGDRVNAVGQGSDVRVARATADASHVRYLKIADGCFNHCTYCLIPKIRGKYVSYPMEELLAEAASLGTVEELVLVAQDTTRYGEDTGENKFVPLLKKLCELDNICHIRLLYCYPEVVTDALIAALRDEPKLLKYIDIPLQHSEDRILKRMGRRSTKEEIRRLVEKLRREIPAIAIRTTFITGFPSETEEEHQRLLAFLDEMQFDNCGFFAYSREPDTPAYRMEGQVHPSTKKRRLKELYARQAAVSHAKMRTWVGKTLHILCDGIEGDGYIGRAYFQAQDVDGAVYFTARSARVGGIYPVVIDAADTYDLFGHCEETL